MFIAAFSEALYGDEEHTEYEEIDDIDDAFRMQCKQIFIGMVTMQYQAKTDMVSNTCINTIYCFVI